MKHSTAIVLTIGVFLVIGYFVYTKPPASPASNLAPDVLAFPDLASASDSVITTATTPPAGTKEYRSATYHFSLFYPHYLKVEERSEGGGATTITFQNVEKAEGFQIFIVPYGELQVSEGRFRQDVSSGVRESVMNITVDGATGAAFYSKNAALGDTREVWVVRGGFLYEITTLRPLDTWLDEIIKTWEFVE